MTTQPTQDPVASESPRDLKYNDGKIDEFVTSLALRYTDRFGYQHYTIEGLRQLAQEAISGFGWILKESFEDGATLTLPNEALLWRSNGDYYRWSGALPKTVPAGSTPESTGGVGQGAWVGIGDAALKTMLASSAGASMIGMAAGGTLEQIINYVTPEQFGAIGDGKAHPLSERYGTLAAAQAVYTFVTALTQTIDWAACQAAENYARGKGKVKAPRTAIYHLGSNYLELSINSKWDSGYPISNDTGQCPRMMRNIESTAPAFGQYCIVRVKNSSAAGSADEFVRGVVFKGFCLTYGLPSRAASKNSQRIGLHLNYGIGACLEVAIKGAEYGVFGYSCWGSTGELVLDSCHKGFYADPVTATPENKSPLPNSNTSFDFRVRVDACPFGIVVRNCQYSKFTGFVEGALVSWANYDSTNETAVAVTAIGCVACEFFLGIEAWQGVHAYVNAGNVKITEHWNQGYNILSTTGRQSAYYTIASLMGGSDPYPTPTGGNSHYFVRNAGSLSVCGLNCDFSNATAYASVYFCSPDSTSRITFDNCSVYFGSNGSRISPSNWANIDTIGGRYIADILSPSGYEYEGRGISYASAYTTQAINGGDGRTVIDAPSGWKIVHVEAWVLISSQSQATSSAPMGIVSSTDTRVILQTPVSAANQFSIQYRLRLKVTK
ncbi:hypothetical protein [Pantoea eucrina]|uniref:tail fiber/spike domain-containing protein n=1 Tax=Pantoea eucrina TaxID=472693 RepID=UPI003CEDA257